jgi:hypothetical protein
VIVTDLDGNVHKWPPTGYVPFDDVTNKSSLHLRARELLKRIFGSQRIMEEVPLPGTRLRLDFYIHTVGLAVEVHGEQHYRYSSYFHGSTWAFIRARGNDRRKVEWCQLNDIALIELPYNESDEEWNSRLMNN